MVWYSPPSRQEKTGKNIKNYKTINIFELDVYDKAQNRIPINIELKIIEYGQYLRYEVETLIKNDLLFWHADSNFLVAIKGIKDNKKIKDDDLDKINEIYKFCNWTTSHVDVGDDYGQRLLKGKIDAFILIAKTFKKR